MKSESSEAAEDVSCTLNTEVWDSTPGCGGTAGDCNFVHSHTDSYCDHREATSFLREDPRITNGSTTQEMYTCKSLPPVSSGEHIRLSSAEDIFKFYNQDILPDLPEEKISSAGNSAEGSCHDLHRGDHPTLQQTEEQVALPLSRVDGCSIFFQQLHIFFMVLP